MNRIKWLLFVSILLGSFTACDLESNSNTTDEPTNPTTTTDPNTPDEELPDEDSPTIITRSIDPPSTNYIIEAGKSVGQITPDATEADIIKSYGSDQVQRREIGLGEGETAAGTIVFPGTDNELIIEWEEGKTYEKISTIRIDGENADWTTSQGIRIGTTLEELKTINGKDFKFYGFEWDYAGTTNEWEDGKISKSLTVILTPTRPEAAFPDLLGDQLFSSDHPKGEAANLTVSSMSIKF